MTTIKIKINIKT